MSCNTNSSNIPSWIRAKIVNSPSFRRTQTIVNSMNLHTICQEGSCPNITECWSKSHAAFLIMGHVCTRACRFCDVEHGRPKPLDVNEPERIGHAAKVMNLKHIVITSVDRDDLPDGGANHFAQTIKAVKDMSPQTTIEVLTPDFLRKPGALEIVVNARPDVYNHNIETVRRIFKSIKLGANYDHSINLLKQVKEMDKSIFTKSGIICGLGETNEEIYSTMDDLRAAKIDFLTIGQYLKPTEKNIDIQRFVTPDEFQEFAKIAKQKGFAMVSSSPLTRSSYHADEDFLALKNAANG